MFYIIIYILYYMRIRYTSHINVIRYIHIRIQAAQMIGWMKHTRVQLARSNSMAAPPTVHWEETSSRCSAFITNAKEHPNVLQLSSQLSPLIRNIIWQTLSICRGRFRMRSMIATQCLNVLRQRRSYFKTSKWSRIFLHSANLNYHFYQWFRVI